MAIIMPYMPRIPAMTTGMMHLKIRSGLEDATSTMAIPDLAVPKAAPRLEKTRADPMPNAPYTIARLGSPRLLTAIYYSDIYFS